MAVPFFLKCTEMIKKTYDITLSILQWNSYLSPIPKLVIGSHAQGSIIHHHPPGGTYGLPGFPQIISQMAPLTFAHFPHLIWSYPSFDNDRPLAVPQLGPLPQRRAVAGIREERRWGGVQPDCPSDGSVPGSDVGEWLRGVPVIRFRVVHWTVEQVEDGARTMERKYEATQRNKAQRLGIGEDQAGGFFHSHCVILINCGYVKVLMWFWPLTSFYSFARKLVAAAAARARQETAATQSSCSTSSATCATRRQSYYPARLGNGPI